jgi:tetratricopeptide (TPR) repeat protein
MIGAIPARLALAGALIALSLLPGLARAQSPLARELEVVAHRYHENPKRLDEIREGLERALETDSHPDNWVALARVSFIWGDIRAATPEEKLRAYERGREAGARAVELAPRDAKAHFWYAVNTGRYGQVQGVLRSLFLLPTIQEEIRIALELDPTLTAVYALAGNVYYEVPALFGGDLDKAEASFRKGLQQDPKFTNMRIGLARTLIKRKRYAEARRELELVLQERAPSNPADWTLKDVPQARAMLGSIADKR